MIFKLIQAVTEYIEAKSEQIREATATHALGEYGRGVQDGYTTAIESMSVDVVYIEGNDDTE